MIEVKGADQLADLAKALKAAGDTELQRELYAGINRAVKPLKADIKKSAQTSLPRRGGLSALVASSKLQTQRKTTMTRAAGVRVIAKNRLSLYHLDIGQIRHKTGRRGVYTIQRIEPGWWTDPTLAVEDDVRREIEDVLTDIADRLSRATRD